MPQGSSVVRPTNGLYLLPKPNPTHSITIHLLYHVCQHAYRLSVFIYFAHLLEKPLLKSSQHKMEEAGLSESYLPEYTSSLPRKKRCKSSQSWVLHLSCSTASLSLRVRNQLQTHTKQQVLSWR